MSPSKLESLSIKCEQLIIVMTTNVDLVIVKNVKPLAQNFGLTPEKNSASGECSSVSIIYEVL